MRHVIASADAALCAFFMARAVRALHRKLSAWQRARESGNETWARSRRRRAVDACHIFKRIRGACRHRTHSTPSFSYLCLSASVIRIDRRVREGRRSGPRAALRHRLLNHRRSASTKNRRESIQEHRQEARTHPRARRPASLASLSFIFQLVVAGASGSRPSPRLRCRSRYGTGRCRVSRRSQCRRRPRP